METQLKDLIGCKVNKIFMNQTHLKFETDKGDFTYEVTGDCCSYSYFYDFYGVENLLKNGAIIDINEVELEHERKIPKPENDSLQFYGYALTTKSKDFGEVTSVFSFRNDSNGYYGGSIYRTGNIEVLPEITQDVIEVKEN